MNKCRKRIIKSIIFICFLFLTVIPASAAMTKKQALNNYEKHMASKPAISEDDERYYFAVADIDGTGIPELLLVYKGDGEYMVYLSGVNGNLITAKLIACPWVLECGYYPGKNLLVLINRDNYVEYFYSKIESNTLKPVFEWGAYEDDFGGLIYRWYDKVPNWKGGEVTLKEVNRRLSEKVGTSVYKDIGFYLNTAANRKKVFGTNSGNVSVSVKLNRSSATVYKDEKLQLKATTTGTSQKVTWTSSNKKVVTVTSSGKITAKKAGKATITAKVNGKTAKCTITVKNPTTKLDKTKSTIYVGTTLQLKATVKGKSSQVSWKSSNSKIATVDSKGRVVAKKAGKVTITAKANGKTAKCTVTVKGLGKPSVSEWKKTYDSAADIFGGNGVEYTVNWSTVKGASGYQVKYYERQEDDDCWYSEEKNIRNTSFSTSFSHINIDLRIKVRAYTTINGQRVYGPWSSLKEKRIRLW